MTDSSTFLETSGLFHGSMTEVMGTRLDVILVHTHQEQAERCWDEIKKEILRLDKLLNKFDVKSELHALNQQAKTTQAHVGDELWRILQRCKHYHEATDGYFDISLKDYTRVRFDSQTRSVYFEDPTIELDLGGYGKGYALEKIKEVLSRNSIVHALVNFGNSSILGVGTHPYGDCWPIGILNPYRSSETLGVMKLKNSSLSTSGNTPNHPKHLLDPHTGIYAEQRKLVSVQMQDAVEAEALSTALMVAPAEVAADLISRFVPDEYLSFVLE